MRSRRCALLGILLSISWPAAPAQRPSTAAIRDVYPDKARYAPHEPVSLIVLLQPGTELTASPVTLRVTFWHLDDHVADLAQQVRFRGRIPVQVTVPWTPPAVDFSGYLAEVRLIGADGRELDRSQTAIDVSSEWNRFPRYGYLAHYSRKEGANPQVWIAELNKFHINGLEYYDFQYRHDQPLAGTVDHPAAQWHDIADRTVNREVVTAFLEAAHQHNMMSMAYNSSYSAYIDAFTNGSGVKLPWATWDTPTTPRTLATVKSLNLPFDHGWATPRLVYMNQNCSGWQDYLFGQMARLFRVYPFDGWHIDTFGTLGAYAWNGSYVNFVAGFRPLIDRARASLDKRIVLNTVNTWGQDQTARSSADFAYSELWEDHETYASIEQAAAQVHNANPQAGIVFAAYLQRAEGKDKPATTKTFNVPGVLLADAVIFASGADHIELGDGTRMLSGEYFPADTRFAVSPDLSAQLRHYYDFLTAWENVLRYDVHPVEMQISLADHPYSPYGIPDTIWTLARQKGSRTIVHLINLLGSDDEHWRDMRADRPPAPLLRNVRVRMILDQDVASAGWASPDVDGGRYHSLMITRGSDHGARYIDIVLPSLRYWDMILFNNRTAGR
jgi:dextranase